MTDNELALRDFDEESEETDSETELLIRHTGSNSHAASSKNKNNNNAQRLRKSSTGYSGIGGPATIGVVVGGSGGGVGVSVGVGSGSGSGSFLGNLFSLGSAAGQIRYRNERSRERAKYSNSNNSGSGSGSGIGSASRDITSDQTKLAQLTQTGAGGVDSSSSGNASHHPQHAVDIGGTANGSIGAHTVIDQENGASTVFYQNNRRRSKSRSLSNVCKMCFCRCVLTFCNHHDDCASASASVCV